jgi:CDP-diglyceride synthetase
VSALWVFVPVLGAAVVHGPVLALDLLPRLKRPLDLGATLRGRPLFGANKTWRGALFMTAGVMVAAALLSLWPWYWHKLPDGIRSAGPWLYGLLLGLGVVLGELPNSFAKRQLDIAPGSQRGGPAGLASSIFDQADFVPAVWLLLLPIWTMSVGQAALAFVVVAAVHTVVNLVGYAIGARSAAR